MLFVRASGLLKIQTNTGKINFPDENVFFSGLLPENQEPES